MMSMLSATASVLLLLVTPSRGHYLPGVTPKSFEEGEMIKLKVNKMTSQVTLFPVDYYKLQFCQPNNGPKMDSENLGEFLSGDRIESSPYVIRMKKDMYCEQVCVTNLGRVQQPMSKKMKKKGVTGNRVIDAIDREYHSNWILDNLPAASVKENAETVSTQYYQGVPIGYIDKDSGRAMVNNHLNMEIHYHKVESSDLFRVVRFLVEPFSISHSFDEKTKDGEVTINNPIASCESDAEKHTDWNMLHKTNMQQVASGQVLFTYDVIWKESDVKWGSRWDIYLNMDNAISPKVHWLNIVNSLLLICVLTGMIAGILVRNLRRDLVRYSKVATDEEKADELEDYGWKLVHADVFRPPSTSPLLLSVMCGSGAQVLGCSLLTIIFCCIGYLNPSYRGGTIMGLLVCYVLMGGVAGYISSRLYKTFKGKMWQRCTTLTATFFPGLCFGTFFLINIAAMTQKSSDAVPFYNILVLLILWFGVSSPLVFIGSYFGFKREAIEFPVNTSSIPRQVPDQPFIMRTPSAFLLCGALPFGSCFVEYYFILSSLWMNEYYNVFGILLVVWIILLLITAEVTVLFNYFSLCGEEYHWWWRSFLSGSSVGAYVFIYSWYYFATLSDSTDEYSGRSSNFATYLLYFGYMNLVSVGLFLMGGFVGMQSCLSFNKSIFGSIKVD